MQSEEVQIVLALSRGPLGIWDLLRHVDGTVREVYAALGSLAGQSVLEFREGRFRLLRPDAPPLLTAADFAASCRRYQEIIHGCPEPVVEFFQARIRPGDLFRRLEFLWARGDLHGREVLVLGDDDYASVALALLGVTRRITALEIDDRVCGFLRDACGKHALEVEVERYDVCDPLPGRYRRRFDLLVTDPVETVQGFRAFLSRGAEALRHPSTVCLGLTEIESSDRKWAEFERAFLDAGFALKDIVRRHTYYEESHSSACDYSGFPLLREAPFPFDPPRESWYHSSLCRARSYREPTPLVEGAVDIGAAFYEDDEIVTN